MSTTTTPTHEPPPPPPASRHASVPILVAAAALVVVVVALVLVFGLHRPPALVTLAEAPDASLTQEIAWLEWDRGESCLHVARPDGAVDRVWCDRQGGELLGWTRDGDLVVRRWDGGSRDLTIDRHTGEVVTTEATAERDRPFRPGEGARNELASYRDRDDLVVEVDGRKIWRVEAPDSYRIHASAVTRDHRWAAFVDSADRLLVVPVDGDGEPRIWARDVSSWQTLVWDDTTVEE